jgi:FtsH-binding integral membrane protein
MHVGILFFLYVFSIGLFLSGLTIIVSSQSIGAIPYLSILGSLLVILGVAFFITGGFALVLMTYALFQKEKEARA